MASQHSSMRAPHRTHVAVPELADEFSISAEWIYREVREGRLEHLRFGRRVVVDREAFTAHARRAAELHVGADLT